MQPLKWEFWSKMLNIWYLYESRIWYQRGSILILNLPRLAQGGSLLRLRNHVWRRKGDENSRTINQRVQLITLRSAEWPTVLEGVWGREENCEEKVQKSESCITSEAEGLLKINLVVVTSKRTCELSHVQKEEEDKWIIYHFGQTPPPRPTYINCWKLVDMKLFCLTSFFLKKVGVKRGHRIKHTLNKGKLWAANGGRR